MRDSGARAGDYARYRPSYPFDAIAAVLDGLTKPRVADLGAGTGISSAALADAGAQVFAVEPNAAMRSSIPSRRSSWLTERQKRRRFPIALSTWSPHFRPTTGLNPITFWPRPSASAGGACASPRFGTSAMKPIRLCLHTATSFGVTWPTVPKPRVVRVLSITTCADTAGRTCASSIFATSVPADGKPDRAHALSLVSAPRRARIRVDGRGIARTLRPSRRIGRRAIRFVDQRAPRRATDELACGASNQAPCQSNFENRVPARSTVRNAGFSIYSKRWGRRATRSGPSRHNRSCAPRVRWFRIGPRSGIWASMRCSPRLYPKSASCGGSSMTASMAPMGSISVPTASRPCSSIASRAR